MGADIKLGLELMDCQLEYDISENYFLMCTKLPSKYTRYDEICTANINNIFLDVN